MNSDPKTAPVADPSAPVVSAETRARVLLTAFRASPSAFVRDAEWSELSDMLSAILPELSHDETADVASAVGERVRYSREADRYLIRGRFAFPASPEGIAAVRRLAEFAAETMRSASVVSDDSRIGRFRSSLASPSVASPVHAFRNVSDSATGEYRFRVEFSADVDALPTGDVPPAILTPELVGRTFDGDEIREWQSHADACDDGTAEFLSRIGVDFETEGGSHECYECGSETGDPDERGEITECADFELTERVVRMLDKAGYGDATREWFAERDGDGADDWEAFAELTDDEIRERLAVPPMVKGPSAIVTDPATGRERIETPDVEKGIRIPDGWAFEADPAGFDGLDSLPFADAGRIVVALTRCVDSYATRGILPPVPGTLTQRARYGRETYAWAWDPSAGTLSNVVGAIRIVHDVRSGRLTVNGETIDAKTGTVHASPFDVGPRAGDWANLSAGSLS